MSFLIKPNLDSASGNPMYTLFVNLLSAASSKSKGRLVAAITKMLVLDEPTPSNYIKNSVFKRREASFSSLDLFVKMESTSSIKIILGD